MICTTLVARFRCVICTPVGIRVEPDVYCRYAIVSVSIFHRLPGGADLDGHRVDGDDAGALLGGPAAEELSYALGGIRGGQDRRRLAVVEHGVQAADVARLGGVEQRYPDATRIERAEERDDVLEVLRAQDGHPVTGFGDLLQPCADRPVAGPEVRPVQLAHNTVAFHGEVDEPVRELVATNLGPLLDMLDQAAVVGELDQSVLQERVVKAHSHSPVEDHTFGAETQTLRIVPGRRLLPL